MSTQQKDVTMQMEMILSPQQLLKSKHQHLHTKKTNYPDAKD